MIVPDASAAEELVLRTPTGARVAARLGRSDGGADAAQAIDDFLALDIARHPHDIFLPRIWQLRSNLTTYDAAYIALAEILPAPLITCDAPLASSPGHRSRVELV